MAFNDGFYWYKNVLKKQLKLASRIYLSIAIVLSPIFLINLANAAAAEKWEYEPVMKDMNIHVKAYKVDQYGNAVNDYEYNTKIDPKTTANRQKMGTVGFGRLLKSTGWGLLGAAALEALLESVDWIIDPEAQSIWRNKKNPDPTYGTCYGGKYLFQASTGYVSTCPMEAIEKYWANASNSSVNYKFKEWIDSPDDVLVYKTKTRITYTVTGTTSSGTKTYPNQYLNHSENPNYVPETPVKEYLTPEALADYANHTHPDYLDPQLAPKIEPKYSPNIATDLWKPSNNWEKENSPTVQEVNSQLDKTNPEPIKPPEITPNPETGGSVLPAFCSWAVTVCEWYSKYKEDSDLSKQHREDEKSFWQKVEDLFNWTKDDSDLPEKEQPDDIPDLDISADEVNLSGSNTCPQDSVTFSVMGKSVTLDMPYQPVCDALNFFKPAVLLVGAVASVYIVAGVRTKEEDQP